VTVAVLLGALWTIPVGVAIGLNPRLSRIAQPIVQIAASFPANMAFPFITILYLRLHVNFELGAIPLMMLGTQWYILFNVIAGAMAIPTDLQEAAAVFKLRGWARWKRLILPGIFPFLVTGCVTAAGGAWNASIVSEIVAWGSQTLAATGLGAYIAQATAAGNWPGIIWGITVMAAFVVGLNRLLWRRLYHLAETRYHIG
jgi:NitT/TauT family transport system permease protein